MLITNARLLGRPADSLWDVETAGDRITAIRPAVARTSSPAGQSATSDQASAPDRATILQDAVDAGGSLLAPQFVEAHIHLDYAETNGVPRANTSGTLFEAIGIWRERKEQGLHSLESVRSNALAAARTLASHGVGFIRTHVDVTDPDMVGLTALLKVREQVRDWMDIQIVAFPQNGIYASPDGDKLMRRAVDMGADVVGAIPHLEPTRDAGVRSLEFAFDLAEAKGLRVDAHCDEIDDPQSRFVDEMTAQAAARSMGERTAVSHAVAMSYYTPGYLARLLPKIASAGVRMAVCPNENLHLQGRGFANPVPRGVAPARQLTDFGIPVSFCQDSLNDPWYPMGSGDLLRITESGLHVGHMLAQPYLDNALDFITTNPAGNLGIADYGIAEGNQASFVLLDATSPYDAVRHDAAILLSVHRGREVFRCERPRVQWAAGMGE